MYFVWHQTKVRSQSFTQTGVIVIVADIYMLTHCQLEKRERDREREGALAALLRVKKKKKTLLDVESAQHKELANYF